MQAFLLNRETGLHLHPFVLNDDSVLFVFKKEKKKEKFAYSP